jgi:hypothetical protein
MSGPKYRIEVDAASLADGFGEFAAEVQQAVEDAVKLASAMTYNKANELAAQKLHSRLKTYQDALSYEEVAPGIWSVSLDESALWIEENVDPHSMVDDLLRHNPKISKKGIRYKVIPFDHSKGAAQQSGKALQIATQVKRELKARGIPLKKLDLNPDGTPKIGTIHRFTGKNSLVSFPPTRKAKNGALDGLSVVQKMNESTGKVERKAMTFRVVTDKHKSEGLWYSPGSTGVRIIDQVYSWIDAQFENVILPEVFNKYR